jgi:pimeloyl-ACP methyl ester carboxylesterase
MRCVYVDAGSLRIHCRTAGHGPPVVLLHPSPQSSRAVWPVAEALAPHCRVYALDTPGYGLSDSLAERPATLDPYLPVLARTLDALGLTRVVLYGAATGAQLAIEFAKAHPERVASIVLDSAGHFSDELCDRVVPDYFPDVTPRADGAHLATWWTMVRDLTTFFPWCDATAAARVSRDMPPLAAVHSTLLEYLRAGTRYDWAYRPAFYNERAERLRDVRVPAVVVRWANSIVLGMTDALLVHALPPNVQALRLGPTPSERIDGIVRAVVVAARALPTAPAIPAAREHADRLAGAWVDGGDGPMHLYAGGDSTARERPLVVLHAAGESARLHLGPAARHLATRRVIVPDLPGHGDTPFTTAVPAEVAAQLAAVLKAMGVADCDVHAHGTGANVAAELATRGDVRVNAIDVHGPVVRNDVAELDLAPRWDGGHVWAAWWRLRDAALWFAPTARTLATARPAGAPAPDVLQARLTELLRAAPCFDAWLAAQRSHDLEATLAQSGVNVRHMP